MKKCGMCKIILSDDNFWIDNSRKDKKSNCCIKCKTERNKNYRKSEKGKKAEKLFRKKYLDTERGKDAMRTARYNKKIRFPERIKARDAIRWRIRCGIIKKGICVECSGKITQAHHKDYSKPLDVIWLCQKCHHNLHKKLTNIPLKK